jgi:hypothetical protein
MRPHSRILIEMKPLRRLQALPTALLLALTAALPPPASAHHSFAAYDVTHTRTIKGTLKTLQWSNPHVTFKMLAKPDGGGEPQEWNIITSGPAILKRFGWTRDSVKPGDRISVVCNPMSDGSHGGRLHTLVLLDTGQTLQTKLSTSAEPELK